jgi:outer membrane protein, heavy metal efflux system
MRYRIVFAARSLLILTLASALSFSSICTRILIAISLTFFLGACSTHSPYDSSYVSKSIEKRIGHDFNLNAEPGKISLPKGVSLNDGLTDDEAIAIALWNNPKFQLDLAELGIARADLLDAGLLRNPILSLLFPLGPKQLEFTLNFPLDLLQRPSRIGAAQLDVQRVAENLVQHGLDVARDAIVSYADLHLAVERKNLAGKTAEVQSEIARISAARLRLGDISELEESSSRLEALRAQEALMRRSQEAELARMQFISLLGLITKEEEPHFTMVTSPIFDSSNMQMADLLKQSFASRPDLRAAEIAIEAAGKKIGWEKSKILNFTAMLDANAQGKEGFEMGPGIQAEIPIFNLNQGKIARAKAQLDQAILQYFVVKNQIALEVKEAFAAYQTAKKTLELSRSKWVPSAIEASDDAMNAYSVGEVSYLYLLQINSQLLEARLREAESTADLRRAEAKLKHSIGFFKQGSVNESQ